MKSSRVLVTGADGYIDSVLGPWLIAAGFDTVGMDTGFYRGGWLYHDKVLVQRDVGELADASFTPAFLRNARAFGASPANGDLLWRPITQTGADRDELPAHAA